MKLQNKMTIEAQEAKTKKMGVDKVSDDGFCGWMLSEITDRTKRFTTVRFSQSDHNDNLTRCAFIWIYGRGMIW